jgi:membrane protein required for colicin V production
MAWVDWGIVLVVLIATLAGMAQGGFRSFCGLAGLLIGLLLALWNYEHFGRLFYPLVPVAPVDNTIAFVVLVLAVMVLGGLVGAVLQRTFRWAGLGCVDSILGAGFGFLQGMLLVMVFVLVTVAFFPGTAWLAEARFPQLFFKACHISMDMSPKELSDRVQETLKKLKRDSPAWMHPGHGVS